MVTVLPGLNDAVGGLITDVSNRSGTPLLFCGACTIGGCDTNAVVVGAQGPASAAVIV